MTLSSTVTRATYTGDGSTLAFPTTFPFFDADEIEVIERVIATGAETVKTLTTHYLVSGGSGSTGTVTAVTAPASSVQWIIRRKTARTQEIDYTPNDPFPAETHEQGLDRLKMNVQELGEENDRALKFPKSDSSSLSALLPSSVDRAGKVLAFDPSTGAPVVSTRTLAELEAPTDAAESAAASAASAVSASASAVEAEAAAALLTDILPARRNVMVNGSFLVWPTDTTISPSTGAYTAEQVYSINGEVTRQAGVSSKYRLRHRRTGLSNQTLTDYFATDSDDGQRFRSQKATISFTCKTGVPNLFGIGGVLHVTILSGTGDNQAHASLTEIETIDVSPTTSDARFTVTSTNVLGASVTQVGVKISGTTSVGGLTGSDYYELENLQIEVGPTATPFEVLPAALIYDECARYFERKTYGGSTSDLVAMGYGASTAVLRGGLSFKPKRTIPAITSSAADTFVALTGSGGAQTGSGIAFDEISDNGARVSLTVASGLTAGDGGEIRRDGTDTCFIDINARL